MARRPAGGTELRSKSIDPVDLQFPSDGRIAPVSRLAAGFLDAIEQAQPTPAGFAEGLSRSGLARHRAPCTQPGPLARYRAGNHGETSVSSILVTGGSGFIGSALVKALVKDGHAVRVLDDNSRGAPRRLTEVEDDIEFIAGDIRDAAVGSACGARHG